MPSMLSGGMKTGWFWRNNAMDPEIDAYDGRYWTWSVVCAIVDKLIVDLSKVIVDFDRRHS